MVLFLFWGGSYKSYLAGVSREMQRSPFLVWLEGYDNRNFRSDSLYLCVPLVRSSRAPDIPLPVLAIEVGSGPLCQGVAIARALQAPPRSPSWVQG